ncbi:MAG: hypothetical protein R3B70_24895, partial [Polyangiaceae bacterium]
LDGAPQKTRTLDPRCTIACLVQENDAITPDASLTRTAAYFWTTGRLIVTGDDSASSGLTRTFIIDDLKNTVTEMPLREPRRFATSFAAPNGTLALAGGVHPDGTPALTVEMFFPE